jgi:hypothetical protein
LSPTDQSWSSSGERNVNLVLAVRGSAATSAGT